VNLPGPDIFLSYNREDAAVAKLFADAFARAGLEVWWDVTLRSGEAYDQVTEEALRNAKAVVVLWSPRSVVSRWVRAEASIADENGTLVPAKIEVCDLPVMFRLTQTAELSNWQGGVDDAAWRTFLTDVVRKVGLVPAPIAPAPGGVPVEGGMANVALVPLTNRGDDELEVIAEDFTEDITRELARSRYFKVIAARTMAAWRGKTFDYRVLGRELDARYLIEGRLQRSGDNIRLTMQLVDAGTGNVVWSPRFACKAGDISEAAEDFPVTVASHLYERILQAERSRAVALTVPCSAWEHMLRAWSYRDRVGSASKRGAVDEARLAVAAAPDLGLAHAWLAEALSSAAQLAFTIDDTQIRQTREHVKQAMRLDGDNPAVLCLLAQCHGELGDGETCLRLALRAVELDPNSAEAQFALGSAYFVMGRVADTIIAFEKFQRLAPAEAVRHMALQELGLCLCMEGRLTEAEAVLDRAIALDPQFGPTFRWKAIAAAELGKEAAARDAMMWLRQAEPGLSGDQHERNMLRIPAMAPHMAKAVAIFRRLWAETGGDA
jgi:TolB-like protein/Flp pilus assembly protein TadD